MTLETTRLPILAKGGLAQQAEDLVAEPGGWVTLENLRCDREGVWRKRSGYARVDADDVYGAAVASLAEVRSVHSYRGALVAVAGVAQPRMYAESQAGWVDLREAAVCSSTRTPLIRTTRESIENPQVCRVNGWECIFYLLGGYLYLKQYDLAGGVILEETALVIDDVQGFRAMVVGDEIALVYVVGGEMKAFSYYPDDAQTSTASPAITFATDPGLPWDAIGLDATNYLVAWGDGTDIRTQKLTVGSHGVAPGLTGTTIYSTPSDPTQVALCLVGSQRWIAYGEPVAGKVSVVRYDATMSFLGNTTLESGLEAIERTAVSPDGWVLWEVNYAGRSGGSGRAVSGVHVDSSGAITSANIHRAYWCHIYSRPFVYRDHPYVILHDETDIGYALVQLDEPITTNSPSFIYHGATCLAVASGFNLLPANPLPDVWPTDTGISPTWRALVQVHTGPTTNYANTRKGLDLIDIDFSANQPALVPATEMLGCLAGTGMMCSWFDGQQVVEQGFFRPPVIVATHKVSSESGHIEGGVDLPKKYLYIAVYEWQDSRGNWHFSPVSDSELVELNGEFNPALLQLDIACLPFTRRGYAAGEQQKNVRIGVFRTLADAPEVFYRLDDPNGASVENARALGFVQFTDTYSDAEVLALGFGRLYTTGGVLDNFRPPSSVAHAVWQNRLWVASTDDPRQVWYSKEILPSEAPAFSPYLFVQVDAPVTALWASGGSLIIATATKLYSLSGLGPADTGAGVDWRGPTALSEALGCIDARSVVDFPGGTIFQAETGLHLLSTPQAPPQFIGGPVLQTVRDLPVCKGAAHDAARGRLLWTFSLEGSGAKTVVYDYLRNAWSLWVPSVSAPGPLAIVGGLHVYGDTVGLMREGGTGGDAGTYFGWTIKTPWVRVASLLGYQRTRRIQFALDRAGASLAKVDIRVNLYVDDDETTTAQTAAFQVSDLLPESPPRVVAELHVAPQKTRSLQVEIKEEQRTGTGIKGQGGVAFYGLELELGTKKGGWKAPVENRKLWFYLSSPSGPAPWLRAPWAATSAGH